MHLGRFSIGGSILLAAVFAGWLAYATPFPGPDELEHVSYAAIMQESGRWLPRFEFHVDLYRDDLRLWSDRINYVGHPSPYYLYIAAFLDRSLPLEAAVGRVRAASLVLLLAGFGLAAAGGAFRGAAAWAFGAGVAWCPEAMTVASQVNNDALAVLAGGLAYWGAVRQRWWALAAALALALWAKANAGLEVGAFAGLLWLLAPGRRDWRGLAALVAGGVVGLLPTLPTVLRYGTVVPVAAETVWPVRSMGGFDAYWPVFLANVGQTWGFMATASWPLDGWAWARAASFGAMLLGVGLGGVLALRRLADVRARVAAAAVLALCLVLPLHLGFAAGRLGYSIPAASFRYYLALWPGLLHALLWGAEMAPAPWMRWGVVGSAGVAFVLGWAT